MNDAWRYFVGLSMTLFAVGLVYIGQGPVAVLPASAGLYMLGSLMWDLLKGE